MRAELKSLLERIVAKQGPAQRGFLGSTRYEVLDNPDMLVEIADWELAEGACDAHARGGCNRRLRAYLRDVSRSVPGYSYKSATLMALGWVGGENRLSGRLPSKYAALFH